MRWPRAWEPLVLLAAALSPASGGSGAEGPSADPPPAARGAVATIAPMSVARAVHTSTLLSDGRVLIAGGFDGAGNNLQTTELYDPNAGRFLPAARMLSARLDHTATVLDDGRVLIAAGVNGGAIATAELYDAAADRFEPTGRLATARNGHNAVRLTDGRILIVGGDVNGTVFLASAEI